jgi:anti-sigma factor RsiW
MSCDEFQPLLRDDSPAVKAHLAGCADCRALAEAERALDNRLAVLRQHPAPLALKQRLRARLPSVDEPRHRRRWLAVPAGAAMAALLLVVFIPRTHGNPVVAEAVADHLRTVYREHPVDIESGGPHQVKPWFTGRLDFALPSVFAGDGDFVLQGGAVSYFLDRKAALLVYKRGLHTLSLFVFRADGLDLPRAERDLGRVVAHAQRERGFSVMVWRDGELGYALVSDVALDDLARLATLLSSS